MMSLRLLLLQRSVLRWKRSSGSRLSGEGGSPFAVYGHEGTSLDTVWSASKCWFPGGARVSFQTEKTRKFLKSEHPKGKESVYERAVL